jgi:hypothetical protein
VYEALSYCCRRRPLLLQAPAECPWLLQPYQTHALQEAVAYVSIRQHASAYVSMRQHACLFQLYEIAAQSVLFKCSPLARSTSPSEPEPARGPSVRVLLLSEVGPEAGCITDAFAIRAALILRLNFLDMRETVEAHAEFALPVRLLCSCGASESRFIPVRVSSL